MKYRHSELAELARVRRRMSWSYERLGAEIGVTGQTVRHWLTGAPCRPHRIVLAAIREFLKRQTETAGERIGPCRCVNGSGIGNGGYCIHGKWVGVYDQT